MTYYANGAARGGFETFYVPRRGQILAPGDYVFRAGAFNNPTKTITVFAGVPWPAEERLPVAGCASLPLEANFVPRIPPSVSTQWQVTGGNGTLSGTSGMTTDFTATAAGEQKVRLTSSNSYGSSKLELVFNAVDIKSIGATDSADAANSASDEDPGVESEVATLYVPVAESGTVDIKVETDPGGFFDTQLPADWRIEKVEGSLDFDGTPGKLKAKILKSTPGDITLQVRSCDIGSDDFRLNVIAVKAELEKEDPDYPSASVPLRYEDYYPSLGDKIITVKAEPADALAGLNVKCEVQTADNGVAIKVGTQETDETTFDDEGKAKFKLSATGLTPTMVPSN